MGISKGDGTPGNPFVVIIPSDVQEMCPALDLPNAMKGYSSALQKSMINGLFGKDTWNLTKKEYLPNPQSPQGDKNLCRWRILVNGWEQSIWFDLSNLSLVLSNHDALTKNPPCSSFLEPRKPIGLN